MAEQSQKLRILYLKKILEEQTNEQHMLNATGLIERLKKYGISADRRTIYTEIDLLKQYGLDVQQKKGTNPGYYIGTRDFELPELKLLVDAVQSSKFITQKQSRQLVTKLGKLCCQQESILSRDVYTENRTKTDNDRVFLNVDRIHTAIHGNKEISFQYTEWSIKKRLSKKKGGTLYVVSPWALIWEDENYYLVAYDGAAGIIKHYRVDKMQNTNVLETPREGQEAFGNFNLPDYVKKTFCMYGGPDAEVHLECRNELAGVIIDRFGKDVWMSPRGEHHFRTHMVVAVSPQFFGWVTGIGPGIRITGPEHVKQQYKAYLQQVLENY